ncbi:phosphoribosylglycinamide formyltransferase [Bacillus thermotolerans]|uniref:Phosphoribosylglycinamide formyltransferase n=1 Tax=Bacillus thermotolerans TaxID=1221996 RepID=A0A0F5HSA9_BACTR|nr:phosphoribosylglycinamide formyltransferase [Bacillus thermotolerans]KKB35737.1 Phosphoribosylglycinamide formyltransferase [Bacillus thermotolerans]KKB40044.1 Phosphoribosylglycinamide formyltransferase [Bacillus thermotolerans]KKB43653.1 Phosphoribosylglycinamide formyltransferase [Bacillus thermotolerans]
MSEASVTRIAVFASGSGSNFQAIADSIVRGEVPAEIALLVCDQPDAYVVERAASLNIPVFSFRAKDYSAKAEFEQEIVNRLRETGVDFIFLAGYMRLIGETLLNAYEGRIVNIHPSLLPAFPGKDAIGQAFQAKVKITGVTIHYVDAGMDTGPVVEQESVRIAEDDTRESLQHKIQHIEHTLYPKVINKLLTEAAMEETNE